MLRRLRLRSPVCAVAGAAAAMASLTNVAYADGLFRRQSPPSNPGDEDNLGASAFGRDPETLERMARALREINNSPLAKQVFGLMRKQEETRLTELEAEKVQYAIYEKLRDMERMEKKAEDYRNSLQQEAQVKAQALRFEDELARKRMQTEHAAQRQQDAELVKMQEASALRREEARRATEQKILEEMIRTEKEKAEIDQEVNRAKALAEAEARVHEEKQSEEVTKRMMLERMKGEKEKWLAAINTTFSHIEGGFKALLTDRSKLIMGIGGVTALAAGVYTTREGARVTWSYINRILGQPSLIRESSMPKFPLPMSRLLKPSSASLSGGAGFENVILHPSLKRRIEHLARATANTKSHGAPFRNMLFYGPPGTGKTLVAREMARKSGLDYAMMTGGDVAPLGSEAVTKIHQIFDWAKKSKKGMLVFIDEADAFLCERNSTHMSEAQRSALNALLFRTGDQSRDIVLVLATNRPGDLDAAITDRIDEVIEFPLPGEEERFQLLKLYLHQYILKEEGKGSWGALFKKQQRKIQVNGISDDLLREAARRIDGFSGREIAKLVASVQAAVYGRPGCTLDPQLFSEVVDYKVTEHHQRIMLASEGMA
ncbi:ATPase family AAA domain-containing protein 3C [Zea mays]|uniref:AAA-type ATPase family protein n=2 Tax=Zea mays TaxID=4577 RepID=A0A096SF33_MAIZE|nr:ATPase family AAA domain-containing protein 3C [Zea mays]AQK74029.1 AAA-type ATPase family protein [Zea mays]AQK74034.1 AAA-type ATPase family protein [Zea mays]|eukprot:XP_008646134.1 ATPase family AAA domain-containing protein 3C [Zea mays]